MDDRVTGKRIDLAISEHLVELPTVDSNSKAVVRVGSDRICPGLFNDHVGNPIHGEVISWQTGRYRIGVIG